MYMGLKESFLAKVQKNEALAEKMRANPEFANSPEMKRQQRIGGVTMMLIGIMIAAANVYAWISVGHALIAAIVLPIFFIPTGIFMIISGKNPFLKPKK